MYLKTLFKTSVASTMIALLLATSAAFADRDGKGKDGGGGGGRDGGGKSVSDGGGRSSDGGSSRSSRSSDSGSSKSFKSSDSGQNFRSSDGNRSTSRTFRDSDSDSRNFRSSDSSRNIQAPQKFEARRPSDGDVNKFLNSKGKDNNNVIRSRDRSPQEKALYDREFKQWNDSWKGNKGDGRDHRDWSGNWKNSDRFNVADSIRRDWNGRRDKDRWFEGDWWRSNHRGNYWNFWGDYSRRYNRPWYWYSWATGPRLGSWIVFGWPTPYYWDYGQGEYLYYDNGAIYVNGRWYQPAPVFYDQTVRIVDQAPVLDADAAAKLEWMPLGVFAVTRDGVAEPEMTVQLAVTKDGVIGGTAFDPKTGAAYNIRGMVDKQTQRAVWSFNNDRNQRIMMESSIYNLTQPEATGMVHYGPNDMRVVELVRLQDPSGGTAAQGAATLPAPVQQ
jgi:hypothetical protein